MVDDFELTIVDGGDPNGAIVIARSGHDLAIEPISCSQLSKLAGFHQSLVATAKGEELKRPTIDELSDFGQSLFNLVMREKVRTIYYRLPNSHVRLQIYSTNANLQALPWEYIQQPGSVPGPDALRSIVRIVPTIGLDPPKPRSFGRAIRMLFVHAEPTRESPVEWLAIKDSIQTEFGTVLPKKKLRLTVIDGAKDSFTKALDGKTYDVLHFSGHGEIAANGVGSLLFQNPNTGYKVPIEAAKVGNYLKGRGFRLVVLSACSTSAGDFAQKYAVVAKTLVECGIPAVIANQFPVNNSIAVAFASTFYRELLATGDVDQATTKGRMTLNFEMKDIEMKRAPIEWGTPTIYRHLGAARIFRKRTLVG